MNKVYLVGAGPGDPDLITVKGRRILSAADSILYDHLAKDALLDLAPPGAERLYVGKKKSAHAFTQEEICAMLIERVRRGLNVVRLKGAIPSFSAAAARKLKRSPTPACRSKSCPASPLRLESPRTPVCR